MRARFVLPLILLGLLAGGIAHSQTMGGFFPDRRTPVGTILPGQDLSYTLGTDTKRWNAAYIATVFSTGVTTASIAAGGTAGSDSVTSLLLQAAIVGASTTPDVRVQSGNTSRQGAILEVRDSAAAPRFQAFDGSAAAIPSKGAFAVQAAGPIRTTDATQTVIIAYTLATDTVSNVVCSTAARRSDIAGVNSVFRRAFFKNVSGTVTQVGTTDTLGADKIEGTISVSWTFTISGTSARFAVTGGAGQSIDWSAVCYIIASAV